MRHLLEVLKWIAQHVYVRKRDLNNGEGKPVPAAEVGIKVEF